MTVFTQTINLGGTLLPYDRPLIMGILNLTRDSFYDGGKYLDLDKAEAHVHQMLSDGADIIDLGAFSSRPGAELVPAAQQLAILEPFVKRIVASIPDIILSIDTFSAEVVKKLADITPFIVNDISGFSYDDLLVPTVADLGLPYILTHNTGTPKDMQSKADYQDVVSSVLFQLSEKLHVLRSAGVKELVVDPGFGFGKLVDHNYQLLSKLEVFKILKCPVMVGLSRKSMIYKPLKTSANEALNGTTALHMVALMNGAQILRVHDVKEASETRILWMQLHSHVNKV